MARATEVALLAFDNPHQAAEVLKRLQQLVRDDLLKLANAAVIQVDADGNATVEETADLKTGGGVLFGAVAGGLFGLIGGPIGAVAGAIAGATTGGVAANKIDFGFSDAFLDEVKGSLAPNTSVIITLVEQRWLERLIDVLDDYDGRLIHHALASQAVAKLILEQRQNDNPNAT